MLKNGMEWNGMESLKDIQERCKGCRPKEEKAYCSARKTMVRKTQQFSPSFQGDDLTISRVLENVPWCIRKEW